METWQEKVALVTNCGSDLGVSIIKELSKNGITTIAFGKTKEVLEAFSSRVKKDPKQAKILLCKCDVGNAQQLEAAVRKISEEYEGIDILINNTSNDCESDEDNLESLKNTIDKTVLATAACIRLVAEIMVERKSRGHIIIVNDSAITKEDNSLNLIDATKTAVSSLNELLRLEFRYLNANIKTTIIECGKLTDDNVEKGIPKAIISVLDTPEHLHVHEMTVE